MKDGNIEKIKEKIHKNEMSVLVGTGFSKNANPKIPLWDELLIDMAKELYEPEFSEWKIKAETNNAYDFLKLKLREVDYLEIVEKYIKFKGMRESLTFYIENKLCPLDKDPGNDLDVHKKLVECNWNNIYTTNYDTLLEQAANSSGKKDYHTIIHSKALSIGPQHRIIKLHGSLRESDCDTFGFDNDQSAHYVISKSDYETYTKKHSAFTHLMRIALLQESFCLIGFSGSDPNFLAWIEWVRDILKDSKDKKDKKVYFIDVNPEECSKERKLFFSNHQIEYISLKNIFGELSRKELINEFLDSIRVANIEKNEKQKNEYVSLKSIFGESSQKELSSNFLDSTIVTNIEENEMQTIQLPSKNYFSLWQELKKQHLFNNPLFEIYKKIEDENRYYKIPNYSVYSSAESLIREKRQNLINGINDSKIDNIEVLGIIAMLQRNSYYNLSAMFAAEEIEKTENVFSKIDIKQLNENQFTKWQNFALSFLRDYRYNLNEKKFNNLFEKLKSTENTASDFYDDIYFEKLLFLANKLDYTELIKGLDNWKLTDESSAWAYIRKAYLFNLIRIPKYQEQITKTVNQAIKKTNIEQEKLWFYEILSFYQFSENFRTDEVITAKIKDYKHKGYYSIDDIMKSLTNKKEKKDIKPSEASRYTITHSMGNPQEDFPWDSVRFIEFLNCFGIPLVPNIKFPVTVFDSNKWFEIAVDVLEGMPREVLFISFQYSGNDMSENFLRTIIQRIVFSKKISNELKFEIFSKCCNSFYYYFSDLGVYNSTFIFAISELISCLSYEKWEKFFYELWVLQTDTSKVINKKFYSSVWGLSNVIPKFLPYIEDNVLLNEMVVTLFEFDFYVDGDDQENTALKYLEKILLYNPFFYAIPSCKEKIKGYVQSLLNKETLSEKELIKIKYYRSKISKKSNRLIRKKLNSIDLSKELIFRWQILLELTDSDVDMDYKLREYLVHNPNIIFSTGINNSGRSGGGWYFKVSDTLKTNEETDYFLDWSREQIIYIFNKLKTSLKQLQDYKAKHQGIFFSFNDEAVLYDMRKFLCVNKTELKKNDDFERFLKDVEEMYFAEIGTDSIIQGLLSDDENQLHWSVVSLIEEMKNYPEKEDDIPWLALLMKIIRKDAVKLELAIEYFSFILTDIIKNQDWVKKYTPFYVEILRNYYENIPAELDRIFVEFFLIKVAKVLKDWKIEDQIIDEWLEIKENSEFLKIRNMTL
ncbi:MAG: SIR2 family protein [Candidatus Cloacimonetes bacterium]|nr:SIR2 family protein [Candidatus Cloacimonadota bacterium]